MDNLTYDKNRVINFSDAIFSIAMTLLVLEVGIPPIKVIAQNTTWIVLGSLLPSFIGLVVSFFVTGVFWVSHLRHMKYVTVIDGKLLWLNMFLLFFIVLLPFSTGYYVIGIDYSGPFIFYCFNLAGIGLFNFLVINYISKKEKGQSGLTPLLGKWYKAVALNGFLVWVIAGVMAFMLPTLAKSLFLIIFISEIFINKYFRKKVKQEGSM